MINDWKSNGKDPESMRKAMNKLSQSMYRPDPIPCNERNEKHEIKQKHKKMGKNKGCN
jgi:hypothetical protein